MLASYVPLLLLAAARPQLWLVKTIISLDWAYVAIATFFLVTHWTAADAIGIMVILVSTSVVALFAWLQMRGLALRQKEAQA